MIRAVPLPSRVVDDVRARLGQASIEDAVLEEVLARYDLHARGRARDLGGRRSRNVLVATAEGPKVVKRYRADWPAATIAYGHSVLGRLEQAGVRAPHVLPTARRGTVADREVAWATQVALGGERFAVFDLMPGRSFSSTAMRRVDRAHLMELAGATLARWHAALVGFRPAGRHHLGFVGWEGPRVRGPDWYRRTVEDLRRDRVGSARLHAEAPALLERIEEGEAALGPLDLPRRVIHGDFGLHNLLLDGGTVGVVDVELARIDLRVTDLLLVMGKHLDGGEPDLGLLAAFFDAYGLLEDREREGIGAAWRYQCATSAVRSWRSAAAAAGSEAAASRVAAAHRSLDRIGWMDANPGAIGRWFGAEAVRADA